MSGTTARTGEDPGLLRQLVRARQLGPRAVLALREDLARDSRLGYGHLGRGAAVLGSLLFLRGAGVVVAEGLLSPTATNLLPTLIAWVLAGIAFVGSIVAATLRRGRLPTAVFSAAMALLVLSVAIDSVTSFHTEQPLLHTSTIFAVGATLLAFVGFRASQQLLLANGVFAVALVALLGVGVARGDNHSDAAIRFLALALLPPLLGAVTVRSFGALVQLELDRSLAESTLLAPRFAFGMRASDELARLDLAAETILDGVANGTLQLPLDAHLSAQSSSIATDLRRLLIAGRHDTWLHHAITESELLGRLVSLTDPAGLSGFLNPIEREGLLSAIWLIVANSTRAQPTVLVSVETHDPEADIDGPDMMGISIALTVHGVPRRRMDPAVWQALDRVGRHTQLITGSSLTIVTKVSTVTPQAAS